MGALRRAPAGRASAQGTPLLSTVPEVATLLRTSPTAIYAMVHRRQIPGIVKIGKRVLFSSAALLDWLDQNRAPSLRE